MPALEPFAEQAFAVLTPSIKSKIVAAPYPGLGDGPFYNELAATLKEFTRNHAAFLLHEIGDIDPKRTNEWISGLWLLAGDIDRSHTLSQDIINREGSFLHAMMHRREGDFSNAKYWFNRVGKHPVIDQLQELTNGEYSDGCDFVDHVARVVRAQNGESEANEERQRCEKLQWIEWQSLMVFCL